MCANFLLVILSLSTFLFFSSPLSPPLTNWYDYFHSSLRLSVQIGIISRHSGLLLLSDVGDLTKWHAEQLADFSYISVGTKSLSPHQPQAAEPFFSPSPLSLIGREATLKPLPSVSLLIFFRGHILYFSS